MASLTASPESAPAPSVTPEPSASTTPSAPTGAEGTTPEATPTASPFDFSTATDDTKVRWIENGQPVEISLKDLREQRLLHAGFTQKTQKLATERKAFETEQGQVKTLREQHALAAKLLGNPDLAEKFLLQQFPQRYQQQPAKPAQQAAAPQFAPGDLLTYEQAQQLVQHQLQSALSGLQGIPQTLQQLQQQLPQQLQQWTAEQLQKHTEELQLRTESAGYAATLEKTFKDLYAAHPALEDVDRFEDVARWQLSQMNPANEQDMVEGLRAIARAQVDKLDARYNKQTAAAVAAKADLTKKGTEPPGGSGVPPAPRSYNRKDSSIDWKQLSADAETRLAQLGR